MILDFFVAPTAAAAAAVFPFVTGCCFTRIGFSFLLVPFVVATLVGVADLAAGFLSLATGVFFSFAAVCFVVAVVVVVVFLAPARGLFDDDVF